MKIVECVPNFSEGRDEAVLARILEALRACGEIRVIDGSMDHDHNRSVVTFLGTPDGVARAAHAACRTALDLIDMRDQKGAHPRIGAVDVVPFIPVMDMDMGEAVALARDFGTAFGERNGVPVYFYGEAARKEERRTLAFLRKGGYERLKDKMTDPRWTPDAGPAAFNPKSGASAVGARDILIAFNINLGTGDLSVAREIAAAIRQSGGGLKHVQAMGVYLASRGIAQVSMNLTNYRETAIRKVYEAVREKAAARGVEILESELIGCVPREALAEGEAEAFNICGFCEERIIENHF
ncbi:MAG TPA: glutamate formimidoyltransferase [Syntrophales bacterium]|nr:glutamate formimidoyltransferase [Syntrophales bacterium]HPX12594.1 glutamate formimidoyltransferase [Syntrophales bacterium]HQB30883.1 glutamate formimidoyltransferase [Syntrophales bacterium]HQN79333.1 glutamate formimidoyltransferase [Syntrophales bacterium]HQQ28536.1 glutamate formimidoyltransferase [Syntrophales bacterium]